MSEERGYSLSLGLLFDKEWYERLVIIPAC